METIIELSEYVSEKAKSYLKDTGEIVEKFPQSIVDFVIEDIGNGCHFPKTYSEKDVVSILRRNKNTLAMACVDVYAKAGAEGQKSHSENGVSRSYSSDWISPNIRANFPNYVNIL